jgi:hypothetical protein
MDLQMLDCCICHKQIKPKYLGKDNDGNDHYWKKVTMLYLYMMVNVVMTAM